MKQANRYWGSEKDQLRDLSQLINQLINGTTNAGGSLTLAASTAVTVVQNQRVAPDSVILFSPTTQNAASASSSMWVSAKTIKTSFDITHESSASSDRTFGYVIFTL